MKIQIVKLFSDLPKYDILYDTLSYLLTTNYNIEIIQNSEDLSCTIYIGNKKTTDRKSVV